MLKLLVRLQQWSGILGVVMLWTAIPLAMHRAGLGLIDVRPISYLAADRLTAALFSVSLLTSAGLFVIYAFYINSRFQVHNRFLAYFLIGQIGQAIAALAPYGTNGPYKLVHTIAAFTLAFSLPFLIQQFTRSQQGTRHHPTYRKLLLLEELAFLVGISLFVFTKGIAPLGEALPAIGFHIWIIATTVIASRA